MALTVTHDSDGRAHYQSDGTVVLTGPIKGAVTTSDGTEYDVSAFAVEVADGHGMEVAELIGQRYMLEGHPDHIYGDQPFVHTPQADMGGIDGPTMGVSTALATQMLDGAGGALVTTVNYLGFVSLNTGATGSTGANEMASVTRQAATWNNASTAAKTNSSSLSFTTPGTTAASDFSTWTLVSSGVFGAGGHLASNVTAVNITVAAGGLTLSLTSSS